MTLFTKLSLNIVIYILLNITTKSDRQTAKKTVNNLKNENIFPLKVSWLSQDGWYLGINNVC